MLILWSSIHDGLRLRELKGLVHNSEDSRWWNQTQNLGFLTLNFTFFQLPKCICPKTERMQTQFLKLIFTRFQCLSLILFYHINVFAPQCIGTCCVNTPAALIRKEGICSWEEGMQIVQSGKTQRGSAKKEECGKRTGQQMCREGKTIAGARWGAKTPQCL